MYDDLKTYLDAIGGHDILTAEQERALGERVAAGLAAQERLDADEPLTRSERSRLNRAARDGRAAQHEFANANLKLVVSIARRSRRPGQDMDEAVADGNLGLLTAVQKFDHRKGFKFSTYATWWIRQAIDRGHQNFGRTIRLPSDAAALESQIVKAKSMIEAGGERATDERLAEYLGRPIERIRLVTSTWQVVSLDAPAFGDPDAPSLGSGLASKLAVSDDDDVSALLDDLSPDVRQILDLRYGISSGRGLSIEVCAKRLGVPRDRMKAMIAEAEETARSSVAAAA